MKKSVLGIICGLALSMLGVYGCSNDDESGAAQFQVKNFANTGCKTVLGTRGEMGDSGLEYIEYKALGNGYLSLNHVNVRFNCEPGELKMWATISGNEIRIVETEQFPGANCICSYDLYCEIGPLADGDYTIIVCEGSELDQTLPGERFRFNISYKNDGRFFPLPSSVTSAAGATTSTAGEAAAGAS
ncbi:MAG: hypothetical protein IJV25_03705 [Prevotella sp.]|nr:hypothetical protein [Prevotella sp.]